MKLLVKRMERTPFYFMILTCLLLLHTKMTNCDENDTNNNHILVCDDGKVGWYFSFYNMLIHVLVIQ